MYARTQGGDSTGAVVARFVNVGAYPTVMSGEDDEQLVRT